MTTLAGFLKEVENHKLTVVRDDGLNRHIRLAEPGTGNCQFDLITWPGHLCVTGDCGTYVFQRTNDMFEFFRQNQKGEKELRINSGYWSEKLLSTCNHGGVKKFCTDLFKKQLDDYIENHWEFEDDDDEELKAVEVKAKVLAEVNEEIVTILDMGKDMALNAAMTFKSEYGHTFEDFWDYEFDKYTHHFLWNLYSIAWGIQQYDLSKESECPTPSKT